MSNYEQIELKAGLNHVVYKNGGAVVAPDTDIYVKLLSNNRYIYLHIGKLNQIGQPGTQNIRHVQSNQIIGTVDTLANSLYVLNPLPSVLPVSAEEPDDASPEQVDASPEQVGGYRRRSTKSHYRQRSTKSRHRRQRTNKKKSRKHKK